MLNLLQNQAGFQGWCTLVRTVTYASGHPVTRSSSVHFLLFSFKLSCAYTRAQPSPETSWVPKVAHSGQHWYLCVLTLKNSMCDCALPSVQFRFDVGRTVVPVRAGNPSSCNHLSPFRRYTRTVGDLHLPMNMISDMDQPSSSESVAAPARSECKP